MIPGHFSTVITDQKNSLITEAVKQPSLVTGASVPKVESVGTVSMAKDESSVKQNGNHVINQTVSDLRTIVLVKLYPYLFS